MENGNNMFHRQMEAASERNEPSRSPTRQQRLAPAALQLDRAAQNPFSPSSGMDGTAIPLLSPLYVPPSLSSSPQEGEEFRLQVNGNGSPDEKGSRVLLDRQEGQQQAAMSDHAEQNVLLTMFQTKLVLANDEFMLKASYF